MSLSHDPLPRSGDEGNDRAYWEPTSAFLKYAIATLFGGAIAFFVALRILAPDQSVRALGAALMCLVALAAAVLRSRGSTRATAYVLAFGVWTVATGIAGFTGGVRAPVVTLYPMLILMVGWLVSRGAALAATILSVAAIFGFVLGESWGLLPLLLPTPPVLYGVVQIALALLSWVLINRFVSSYQFRIKELHSAGTELARRSRILEASQAELNRAQAVGRIGSWNYDIPEDRMRLSAETCRIFGLPEGTMGNRQAYLARTHAQDRDAVDAAWQAALKGAAFDHEHRVMLGREVRWVRQKAEFEFAADGTARRALGVTQDITRRKEVEAEALSAGNKLQATLDAIPDLLFEVGSDGRILDYHSPRTELLAVPPEVFLGRTFFQTLPPDAADVCASALREAQETGKSIGRQYDLQLPQGKLWFELSVSRKAGLAGEESRFIFLAREITERKTVEEELRKAVAFSASLAEAMPLPVFHKDASGRYTGCNSAFARFIGKSGSEIIGKTVFEVAPQAFAKTYQDKDLELLDDPVGMQTYESSVVHADHTVRRIIFHKARLTDNLGMPTGIVGIMTDITERKAAEDEINHLAFYDPLTRLPNRRLLLDRLRQALAAITRSRREGALLFIDLDNFKTLNDTLGHDVGDLLLQQVAQRLSTCIREGDTVARLGGDEFVIILEGLSENPQEAANQTESVGAKILAACNQPYLLAGHPHHSTPSIGATLFSNHHNSVDELLKRADLAMYQAKASGRNTMSFFDPEMQATVTARATLEFDLRQGLQQGEFHLYYQSQVDQQGRTTGAEALLRWQHPRRGLVLPAQFIPLAEETGLILPLGHWVLEAACKQLVAWAAEAETAHLTLAINVSARQFHRPDFVGQVLDVIRRTGADPRKLKLELTESMLLDDVEDVIAKMTALKGKGVGFALDDFGTGYSSLSYLKRLPLDQLKIDQSFVRDILIDPSDAAIARTIVALARSMGMGVIAEGVETEAQRDALAENGCQAYQGYLFSHPLPLAAFGIPRRKS